MIWIIYQILNQGNGDIIAINQDVLGKWIGGLFNFIFIYIVLLGATTLHTYIEVVHVWMFPSISSWIIAGAFGSMLLHCDWRISCSCRNWLLWNRYPKHSNLHIFLSFAVCRFSEFISNCTAFIPRNHERNERKYV